MKNLKTFIANLWKDEAAQGTAEYVLLIAIVVAIITLFRNQIKSAIAGKIGDVQGSISGFNADQ